MIHLESTREGKRRKAGEEEEEEEEEGLFRG
jgi:hypothetical protein